ncbi:MAG: T9SS type A sorting domain-containing protein [Chlorobi bacterium]|nr:T9SS type A sorting domain-containing protein [Chlorobiota bacterium]
MANRTDLCWDIDDEELMCITHEQCTNLQNQGENVEWHSGKTCWIFSAVAGVEAVSNIYFNDHIDFNLSEQELTACIWGNIAGSNKKALDYIRDSGVTNEECYPYMADDGDCDDLCVNPTEQVFIIDNESVTNTNEELKKALIEYGPLPVGGFYFPYGTMGHAELLVGFDQINEGDLIQGISGPIPENSPYIGKTYWICKDSNADPDEGWDYYFWFPYSGGTGLPSERRKIITPVTSMNYAEEDRLCRDEDNDGYYNWGIGAPPVNCNGPKDGDDSDIKWGPIDENGFSTLINSYNTSFEENYDGWKQSGNDDLDWVKHQGETPWAPDYGPENAQDGDFYIYISSYFAGVGHPNKNAILESPLIDLSRFCQYELSFYFHRETTNWGYEGNKLQVLTSSNGGQAWSVFWSDYGECIGCNDWVYINLTIPFNVDKIQFKAITGLNEYTDIALDNISITPVIDDPIVIVGEEEWEGQHTICSDIVIEPNAKLTLLPGCELNMFTEAKIIVKRTAELVIDDAMITDNNNQLWKGINVWGNANQGQSYSYQGNVKIINGGMIENAVCGIQTIKFNETTSAPDYNYTGGMVFADGGTFKNCRVAAKFWRYNYNLGSSFFRDCQFITNSNMLPSTDPDVFIKASNLSRLTVIGSGFTDSRSVASPVELTSGIEASDTYLRVYPYGSQKCAFTNLYNGIRVYAHTPEKTVWIKDNLFTDNFHSIYLSTVMEPTVTGNEFTPWGGPTGDPDNSYCLYVDYCTGYTIEENIFSHEGIHPKGIGLVINNSGSNNNEIYNNEFINLEFATLAQNNNRGLFDFEGLVIKCNDYDDNSNDIAVTSNELVAYPGIAKHQGAPGPTNYQAGNLFSLNNNGINFSDYSTFKESPITYFHHSPFPEPRVKPIYYTDKYIFLDNQGTPYSESISCPSHLSGGGGGGIGRDDLKSNMASSNIKADSTQTLLTALVDGGNTDVLQQEVLQTMPQEAYDLYMSLMGKSPYLSDSVLIATIEKEYILPNVLIKDILAANPQSAKSPEVMDKVDEKAIPMTEEQLAEILLGKYIVAAKEKLESQLAYYKHQRSISLKFLKQSYRNDTVDPYAHDSLVYLLETENGLQDKFELVFAYAAQDNWTGAMALMNNLPNQFSFKQNEQEMYNDYNTFINVLYGLDQAGTGLEGLTTAQNTSLLQLADNVQNYAGSYARNILIGTDNYPYTEPIILPGDGLKSGSITFDLPVSKDYRPEYINIYPNPAMDYIIVELNKTNLNGVNLSLYDNGGKLVKQTVVPARIQDYVIGLKGMKPGIYIIKADMDGKDIGGKKFSIIK